MLLAEPRVSMLNYIVHINDDSGIVIVSARETKREPNCPAAAPERCGGELLRELRAVAAAASCCGVMHRERRSRRSRLSESARAISKRPSMQ
jgi:hypothetical protein